MKRFAIFSLYWAVVLLLLTAILCSMDYNVPEALLLSASLLPIAIIARQMIARVSFTSSRLQTIKSLVCILLFTLVAAFAAVHLAQSYILQLRQELMWKVEMPPMLLNPVFMLSIFALMIIGDYGLGRIFGKRLPEAEETITFASDLLSTTFEGQDDSSPKANESITFISNRKNVTLERQEILYVESCDTEVWIHATGNRRYRNKTPISSWSRLLGSEYLRIHRSYLVRLSVCTGLDHDNVILGNIRLPISRKYKEEVQHYLNNTLS